MAELDEKLLKALDDRLKNMLTTITSLDSALNTVVSNSKSSLNDLISLFQASGASLTDMLQAFKGNNLADLLDIKDAAGQVKQLNEQIETLKRNTRMGGKASLVEDADTGAVSWKVLEGDEFKNAKEERDAINALAEARQKLHDLTLSDAQLMEKIVSLINKAAVETRKEESAKEREFQKAVKQQEELARKYAEIEKLRADVFGDKPYGKLSGKEKMQWIEYEDSLKKIKAQMEEIEKSSTGSKAEGERIFKEQEAVAKAKLALAEKERREKEEAARQEKELNKAIADEARRKKEDENEYLRLLKERNKLLEQNARLAENKRNAGLTGYIDTSNYFGSQQDKNDARLRQLNDEIQLYEESVKLTADGQRRKEEMELAHENRMTEIKVQGEQKREQILDRESNKKKSKAERDAKTEEAIQKQADSLVKRRISLTNEISRIDNNRAIRQKTNTNITQQALDAEEKKYQALKAMVDQLTASLAELEKKQSGVTAKAEAKNAPYQQYTQAKEEERVNAELERRNKLLKDNKRTMDSMLPTLQRLASAFGVAFSVRGLAQFGKKLIETRGEFERQQVALRSILQNKQLADEIWDKTMQAALQSPFTAMQLTTYTKQLAAYRIETDKLFETTKRLADVSAGLGVDMQRLILAYGQVKAANYLRASEIRQFTEAGVNVLGELRDYFNDVKGMSVDTAKVMDMVQKRLVKFEDVEAIFKRMTDQGGIFFEMQYVQSQTVRGQIAKLHDAYDQMLNSIGKANQGALRTFVGLLNNIVKNWREFKTVIDLIAWPLLISFVYKFSRGLMTIATASRLASTGMSKVVVAGAKTKEMFKKLLATIAAHPFIALGAAVAAVGVALLNHAKHVRDINKRYEDLMSRTYETKKNLDGLSETIQNNLDTMKKATKGSKEYNEASRENENIVKKLKDQYPELLQDLDLQKDGYEKLIEKIKEYNDELENQIRLEYAARASFWQDDLTTNIADLQETQREREMQFLRNREKAEKKYLELKAQGKEAEEDEWDARIRNAKTWQEQYDILMEFARTQGARSSGYELPIGLSTFWGRDVKTRTKDLEKNIENEALVFNDIIRDQLKTIKEDLGDDIQQFIKDNESQINELFKDKEGAGWKLLNKQITKFFTEKGATSKETRRVIQDFLNKYLLVPIQLDWGDTETNTTATKELADWQKRVNEAIDKATGDFNKKRAALSEDAKKNMPEIEVYKIKDPLKTLEDAQSEILKKLKEVRAKIASYEVKGQVAIDNAEYQALKLTEQEMEQVRILLGAVAKVTGGGGHKENASKLISLIKEMRSEYDKLSKSAYGYAKSEEKVRDSFKQSYEDILKETGVAANFDFTTNQGEIEALKKVRDYIKGNAKYAKDAWKDVQKTIDQLTAETEIEISVRIREDFGKQMEDMFSNYELTLELQKLNIPADAAKDLFPDFTEDTLGDLQKRLREFYEERQKKDEKGNVLFSEEDLKEYRKWADKIDSEILKERKEKAKEYSKYLEKEYSERAKLEMQHAKDIAFVTANVADDKQRNTIIANINKKYQDDLNELKWKSFKESSFYVDMMDDIASLPAEYTKMMLDKINEILEHPEKLSPRALKEAVNARQKVIEAQIATKPLSVMTNAGKEIREARKLLKQDEEITVKWWESTRRALDEQIKAEANSIAEDEKKINSLQGLQGELAGYERLLEKLKEATSKVDNEGLNKLMGLDLGESISELSPEEIENKIEELKTLLDSQRSLYDATEKTDEQNARAVEIEQIEKLIETLRGELEARKALASFNLSNEAKEALGAGETSSTIGSQISGIETSKEGKQKRLTNWKEYRKQFKNFTEAYADFNKNVNDMVVKVRDMGNAWYDMFDALGGETNALTDGWKEFGNTITDVSTKTLTLLPQMVVAFQSAGTSINASLGLIGLIAEAVQLVFVAIGAFAKLHDAKYEREIEIQQKKIDSLTRAYERLEKQIEKTWDTVSYITTYNEETQNLYDQIAAIKDQISAEEAKKNADEDKIQGYEDSIQEALDKLEELKQAQIEVFGGIGEEGYRDAAQGFVDAWKSAFLETGDGLQGLQDHFDEFLNDWFVKQATMRIAGNALEPLFRQIDQAVSQYSSEGSRLTPSELEAIRERFGIMAQGLSEDLGELYNLFGLGGEGSLSGLAAGIQGMSEEQANILEAYWNSVRGYTASIDMNVSRIVEILGGGGDRSNPQLTYLDSIATSTGKMYALFSSMQTNDGSGSGLRVYAM